MSDSKETTQLTQEDKEILANLELIENLEVLENLDELESLDETANESEVNQ